MRVSHRQLLNLNTPNLMVRGVFIAGAKKLGADLRINFSLMKIVSYVEIRVVLFS